MSAMLMLVHSPLVGPRTWTTTAPWLNKAGFATAAPDLTGAVQLGPPYYPRLARVAAAAAAAGRSPVILVAHSGAGPLLPSIAEHLGDRAEAAIYLDAQLPHPGQAWVDVVPPALCQQLCALADGDLLPPWDCWFPAGVLDALLPDPALRAEFVDEIPRLQVGYFHEPAPTAKHLPPAAFLRLSEAYDQAADEAARRGWRVDRRDWDHLRMLTQPDAVADLIAATASALLR